MRKTNNKGGGVLRNSKHVHVLLSEGNFFLRGVGVVCLVVARTKFRKTDAEKASVSLS